MIHELKQDTRIKNKNNEFPAQFKANVAVSTLVSLMLLYNNFCAELGSIKPIHISHQQTSWGSPNRGPQGSILRLAPKFVNYVYTIKTTP
jgi:hypothetical protein